MNKNLEKMIMSLGKDNTDFYVDFDTIADWVETKQVKNLSDFKALIDSKGLVITYELSKALYKVITNIDLFYNDEPILKNFRHKKNLANNENLKKLNNFLDNRIYLLKNKKKKEGNDTIENLKKAIDTKDKIKIGNILAYQKYQTQYKHMAKLINSNIDVIQEDEIYNILNRSNSVEEFCCNTTMNLINRINSVKFVEGRVIELDETSLGMAENNYLDINNKIVLICGLDLNPKYNEAMNRKKKKYGTTNDSVFTILELVAYMKPEEYRGMYNQVKLINWAKENYKEDYDLIENISNNVSKTFGCGCHRDKTGNDLEEIIIDSLINDINHDLLDIELYYFDLTKDQREIVETINNISLEQEGNFRRFDNREFIDFVKGALKTEMTPFTIFTIKFDLFVKSNSQNYQDVINHIFVDNPLVFPGCVDVETFLIDYTKLITNDLKLVKLPYEIFKNMVKEIEGKPYLSAYLELTKLMVPDKTHLIDEILSEIDNLKENDIFINMVNQCNDFDDLFEKYKLFSNSVSIVPIGFVKGGFVFKEIPVERCATKNVKLRGYDISKSQSIDKTKKEANSSYIKRIVSEYNKAVKTGVTINRDLIRFIENDPTRLMIDFSEYATEMVFLDIQKLKETFLSKLINWAKENYKEVYDLIENISSINNKIESNNDDILFGTNILLLYSYILELYKRIGYFEKDVEIFKSYSKFIWDYSRKIELKTNEMYIKAFDKAYNNFLETNLK